MKAFRVGISARLVLAAATLAMCVAGRSLQAQAPQEGQQEPTPRFRAEVSAVLVDVLVLDQEGYPVSGLAPEDFQVFEDGVLQQVDNFDVVDWASYVQRAEPEADVPDAPAPAPEAGVNTFPRRFIFIVNRQNARFRFLTKSKEALEEFVVDSMAEGDEAAVIDMGLSNRVLQEFNDSKQETLAAIRRISVMEEDHYTGTESELEARNIYDTLEGLGQGLAAIPGRKIIVFMSPQMRGTQTLLGNLMDTVHALNQSNTTVYSVNIDGVGGISAETTEPADLSEVLVDLDALEASNTDLTPNDSFAIGGLFPLANETGGRYYYNTEAFGPVLQRIGRENSRYYMLTYTPSNADFDGSFRRIEVKVDRPDVDVVARRGYIARKGSEPLTADAAQEPPSPPAPAPAAPVSGEGGDVDNAPPAPLRPPAQLEITTYLLAASAESNEVDVPMTVALPLELLFEDGSEAPRTLTLSITDSDQRLVEEFTNQVDPLNFFVVRSPKLVPGVYLLQLTVSSSAGEQIYQASTELNVPSGFGERFGFSSILPVFPPRVGESGNPTILIRPTLTLRNGEDALVYFRVFSGEQGTANDDAKLTFMIRQENRVVRSGEHPNTLPISSSGQAGFPVVLRLPTGGLPSGSYQVALNLSSASSGRRASTEIELTIDP